MNEQDIRTRIEELQKLRDNALANANAIGGAIQDCEFWLERLSAQAKPGPLHVVKDEDAPSEA